MTKEELISILNDCDHLIKINSNVYVAVTDVLTLLINGVYVDFIKIELNSMIQQVIIDNAIYCPYSMIKELRIL